MYVMRGVWFVGEIAIVRKYENVNENWTIPDKVFM